MFGGQTVKDLRSGWKCENLCEFLNMRSLIVLINRRLEVESNVLQNKRLSQEVLDPENLPAILALSKSVA